jgi:hypothetical protein
MSTTGDEQVTADPETMTAFADAAVAFMNDGINRLPLEKQLQLKAHTDAAHTGHQHSQDTEAS